MFWPKDVVLKIEKKLPADEEEKIYRGVLGYIRDDQTLAARLGALAWRKSTRTRSPGTGTS